MAAHRQESQQESTKHSGASTATEETDLATEQQIDTMFPDEASLESIEVVAENMQKRLVTIRNTMRTLLRVQSTGSDPQQGVEATKAAIGELHQRISEMKSKARTSERMVLDITQDIKALDSAKRNLTQTTTTMKRLQMLIAAVGQLRRLKEQRKWNEAAAVMSAVSGLTEGFADFNRIKPMAALLSEAQKLQRETADQAVSEVERGFDVQGLLIGDVQTMRDACDCAKAFGVESRIVDFYCSLQMRAYAAIFQLNDDVSQLENVSRRYAWLRRILRNYAESHAAVFPDSWRVAEVLSRRFSEATRDQLGELMATRDTVNPENLMSALADTLAFESQCNKKFNIVLAKDSSAAEKIFVYEGSGEPALSFTGAISCAFEPYMAIFIRGEQSKFDALVAKFQSSPIAVDDDPSLSVLASSTDILYQFRESLRQCASLSTGQAMLDLANVFSQSLVKYARDVLIFKLPSVPTLDDLKHVCLIVNTADYCASVVAQLEAKIMERIDLAYKPRISFVSCREALLGAINTSIRVLVAGVESLCEPAFAALSQVPWHNLQSVGDQSAYVSMVSSAVETATKSIRQNMNGTRYLRSYCDKFVVRFSERYMAAINKCQSISEVGAEQLLLDAQALKSILLTMPQIGAEEKVEVGASYSRIVSLGVGKIEALLKALLAPADPPEALVDRFLLLFPKAPRDTFVQILGLKAIRPAEQHTYQRLLHRMLRETSSGDTDSTAIQTTKESRIPNTTTDKEQQMFVDKRDNMEKKQVAPSSAPLSSQRPRKTEKPGEHLRLASNASSGMVFGGDTRSPTHHRDLSYDLSQSSVTQGGRNLGYGGSYVQSPLSTGDGHFNPDPLGITGAGGNKPGMGRTAVHQRAFSNSQQPGNESVRSNADNDGTSSPVLASLAANATATRSKINENLRKFLTSNYF